LIQEAGKIYQLSEWEQQKYKGILLINEKNNTSDLAILIHTKLAQNKETTITKINNRIQKLTIMVPIKLTIINIHAENSKTEQEESVKTIKKMCLPRNVLIMGDLNSGQQKNNNYLYQELSRYYIDAYQMLHPYKKKYTRYQIFQGRINKSRIDHMFIHGTL